MQWKKRKEIQIYIFYSSRVVPVQAIINRIGHIGAILFMYYEF